MAKVFWKGSTLLAPVPPTMVSCGTMEKPNIITVAWTGIVNSQPPMTYISVRPSRYSYELIKQSGEFVINLTPASLVRQADWCGVKSGREVDKFEACKLTPLAANQVSAPLIAECPGMPGQNRHPAGQPRHVPGRHRGRECRRAVPGRKWQALRGPVQPCLLYARGIFCAGQKAGHLWLQRSQENEAPSGPPRKKIAKKIIFFAKRC